MKGLLAICFLIVTLIRSSAGATISIEPSALVVNPGQTFSLSLSTSNVVDVYAFQLDLTFTSDVLFAVNNAEGGFLPGGGATLFVPGLIDNVVGSIVFIADTLVSATPGVNGGGVLATVQFRALSPGTSPIVLSNVLVLDSALSAVAVNTVGSSVTVSAVPEPATAGLLVVALGALLARGCIRVWIQIPKP